MRLTPSIPVFWLWGEGGGEGGEGEGIEGRGWWGDEVCVRKHYRRDGNT